MNNECLQFEDFLILRIEDMNVRVNQVLIPIRDSLLRILEKEISFKGN